MRKKRKIAVAMSGGVDSSTAAGLLKEQGHDVIGVGMRLTSDNQCNRKDSCCGTEGMKDARRVADKLGIPFHILNYEEIFQKEVIDYFKTSYAEGQTPNPCIRCNGALKFDCLLKTVLASGVEALATGHYSKVEWDEKSGRFLLRRAGDHTKDQSYFLYNLTQEQLSKIVFPLGDISKVETRKLAKSFDLPVHEKKASQDICFVPDGNYQEYLAKEFPNLVEPGQIKDETGKLVGQHKGIAFYTIGQRSGLGIAASHRLYVTGVDVKERTVYIGDGSTLHQDQIKVNKVNWISIPQPSEKIRIKAKIRYRQKESDAWLLPSGTDQAEVLFDNPQRAPASGQAVVFYQGDLVVGGGTIKSDKG